MTSAAKEIPRSSGGSEVDCSTRLDRTFFREEHRWQHCEHLSRALSRSTGEEVMLQNQLHLVMGGVVLLNVQGSKEAINDSVWNDYTITGHSERFITFYDEQAFMGNGD